MGTKFESIQASHQSQQDASLEMQQSHHDEQMGDETHLSELAASPPTRTSSKSRRSLERQESRAKSRRSSQPSHYSREEELTEVAAATPRRRRSDLEQALEEHSSSPSPPSHDTAIQEQEKAHPSVPKTSTEVVARSQLATELYIHSHLIFFSILGVLARLGVEAITAYPGAPVITNVLWANFGGSLIFGLLLEDQRLFREEWGVESSATFNNLGSSGDESALVAAKKKHTTVKKTIPLYIGLSTGFCGSFTSFSSFVRDVFLAMSNSIKDPALSSIPSRHRGYDVTALLAILIIEIGVSLSGLIFGAHIALALDRFMPSLPFRFCRRYLDPLIVFLGFGSWLGAVFLAIFPPEDVWRGRAVFAIVFGPLGCLARFYASKYLNSRIPSFPLGTFAVNVFGTIILGMCYDLQHSVHVTALGAGHASVIGCQVLDGVMEGFCGALTTVSTWVGELNGLKRRHAYIYGATSVIVSFCFLVVIMGSLKWTEGFGQIACSI